MLLRTKTKSRVHLTSEFRRLGLRTWFDEAELKLGDSLTLKIDEGLAKSRAGVLILSHCFFAKKWTDYELRGLNALVMASKSRIIPIWHRVSQKDVALFSPALGDMYSGSTTEGFDRLAMKIVEAVRPDLMSSVFRRVVYRAMSDSLPTEFVESRDVQDGPIRHISLPQHITNRIELVRQAFRKVDRQSLAEWVAGFQRDAHPSDELRIWEDMAARFTRATTTHSLSVEKATNLYFALLVGSTGDREGAASLLVKAFGKKAGKVLASMKERPTFTRQSAEDRRLRAQMGIQEEDLIDIKGGIDIDYIESLVQNGLFRT